MNWFKSKTEEKAEEVKEKPISPALLLINNDWITPHLLEVTLMIEGEYLPKFWVKKTDWEAYGLKPLLPAILERIDYYPFVKNGRAIRSLEMLVRHSVDYRELNVVEYPPTAAQQAIKTVVF